jgi:hypothetical protein
MRCSRVVTLTHSMLARKIITPRLGICKKCEKEFTDDDLPYSIFTKKMGCRTYWYHIKCAKQVNLL